MDELVVGLLAVLVLPVLLVGGLLRWFWRLSKADDLGSQLPGLPRYRPGRQNGRPLAIIWHATVPFLRCGAPLNELKP